MKLTKITERLNRKIGRNKGFHFLTGDESFRILIKMKETSFHHEHFNLYNQSGNRIHGDIRYKSTLKEKPVVVICHSFMALKDWGFFPVIGEWFAKSGFIALTFNYSHDGVEGDNDRAVQSWIGR